MSNALPAREPTMDEILASIRQIIETGDERVAPYRKGRTGSPEGGVPMPKLVASDGAARAEMPDAAAPAMQATAKAETVTAAAAKTEPAVGQEPGSPPGRAAEKAEEVDGFFSEFDEESFASELLARVDTEAEPAAPHNPANDAGGAEAGPRAASFEEIRDELRLRAMDADQRPGGEGGLAAKAASDETSALRRASEGEAPRAAVAANAPEPADTRADRPAGVPERLGRDLVSTRVEDLVGASFHELASTVWEAERQRTGETVQAMIRPMLQEWLDQNLPYIVENLVREEIERIARGPR